jgi:hypothetical protein
MESKRFPRLKKKISDFLSEEDGKITKQALVSLGAFLSTGALGTALFSNSVSADLVHTNALGLSYSAGTGTANPPAPLNPLNA